MVKRKVVDVSPDTGAADKLAPSVINEIPTVSASDSQYRKRALSHYRRSVSGTDMNVCVVCGFGIQSILEVAHLDQNRKNNAIDNLAILCPNCHKMHDIGLIPKEVVCTLRDAVPEENWKLRIKDAGAKAAATRKSRAIKATKSATAKQAWVTRVSKADPTVAK